MKLIYLLFFIFIANLAIAQNTTSNLSINSTDLIKESTKYDGEDKNKQMVMWLPYDFWELVGKQQNLNKKAIEEISSKMKNYLMFCVVDYNIELTEITFKSDAEIREDLKIIDSKGTVFLPLKEEDLPYEVEQLVGRFRPVLARLLGEIGTGMRIFIFEAEQKEGKPVLDIYSANHFSMTWKETDVKWKLPFACVLPKKTCPVDKEELQGNFEYCPFHGNKLEE